MLHNTVIQKNVKNVGVKSLAKDTCIICGNAALTNLHLDTEAIASDKLGLNPCKIFCTTTLSNV